MGNQNSGLFGLCKRRQQAPYRSAYRPTSNSVPYRTYNQSDQTNAMLRSKQFREAYSHETHKYDDDEPLDVKEHKHVNPTPNTPTATPTGFNLEDNISLTMRLKRKVIQSSSFTEQVYPMLVTLTTNEMDASERSPIDLVCVIDHSGSMSGAKIELVKNTFKYLLKYLTDSDRLSIVIFDNNARRLTPLLRTDDSNKDRILNIIKGIYAQGGTNINLGMLHAFDILKQRKESNAVSSIFLLSDGLDSGAQLCVKASLEALEVSSDIIINTFGFGNDHDPQLMTEIAKLRDGNFYFVEQLHHIDEAFIDCLGGLVTSVAQSATIRIKATESKVLKGIQIKKAYGTTDMWTKKGQTYQTKLTGLISGRQKNFVLDVSIPINKNQLKDDQKDVQVASAEVEIVAFDNKKVIKKAELHITVLNEVEELKEDDVEDDQEVMKNLYRVKGASLINEARDIADKGKHEDAKKMLKDFKEELENSSLKKEQFVKNLIADIAGAMEDVNPVVYEQAGRHKMWAQGYAQMQERSNLCSMNAYQNSGQERFKASLYKMKYC